MVESTYGTANYKYNEVKAEEFFNTGGGAGDMHSHNAGKSNHGGVGGKGSKSHNFKECKNANKRRFEKKEREAAKELNKKQAEW